MNWLVDFFINCSTWNNCHVDLFNQVLKSMWAVLFSHSVLWCLGVSVPRGTIFIWTYSAKYLNRRERFSFPTTFWDDLCVSVPRGTIVIWTYSAKYLNRPDRFIVPQSFGMIRCQCSTWNIFIWHTAANHLISTWIVHFFPQRFRLILDRLFHVEHCHLTHCSQPPQLDVNSSLFPTAL